jgi:hypothetical protein
MFSDKVNHKSEKRTTGAVRIPMGIQKTANYEMFDTITGNRGLSETHVANLTLSIMKNNLLAQNPILVNEKFQVIDGQHRLAVARNNGLEIYYLVVQGAAIDEVVLLNSSNKAWSIQDYIDSYASRGNENYLWLKNFTSEYVLNLTQALIFVYGADVKWGYTKVKRGDFVVSDEQRRIATERADVLWDLRPFIKKKGILPRAFVRAIAEMYDEGLGKKLVQSITKQGKPVVPAIIVKDAVAQLHSYV